MSEFENEVETEDVPLAPEEHPDNAEEALEEDYEDHSDPVAFDESDLDEIDFDSVDTDDVPVVGEENG